MLETLYVCVGPSCGQQPPGGTSGRWHGGWVGDSRGVCTRAMRGLATSMHMERVPSQQQAGAGGTGSGLRTHIK